MHNEKKYFFVESIKKCIFEKTNGMISIVLPVFNEAKNIIPMYEKLTEILAQLNYPYEILFVNDGSEDDTLLIIKEISSKDKQVKRISFTRNFGHQAAIIAGLNNANGDAIITMDCDFQDPPEIIPEFVKKWEQGNKIVYGRRTSRKDKFFKKTSAKLYYKLLNFSSEVKMPDNIGDYRLIDKSVFRMVRENNISTEYLRGLIPWFGYKYDIVNYERPIRKLGKTNFSLIKMLRFGLQGLLSFSIMPLRLGLLVGISVILSGVIFLSYLLFNFLINEEFYKLLEWLAAFSYILIGFLFVLIWILAEYIFSVSNKTKGMPMYIIDDSIEEKQGNNENSDS